jgi:hypothetical protein
MVPSFPRDVVIARRRALATKIAEKLTATKGGVEHNHQILSALMQDPVRRP